MSAATKTEDETSLEIKRFINAPRSQVYAAWTDPAHLKLWFGPEWVKTRDFVCEVRPGGKFRWDLINCDGEEKTIGGEYGEIIPGRRSFSPGSTTMRKPGEIERAS